MATKKDIAELKTSISQINQAIGKIRDWVIKALLAENNALKERVKTLEIEAREMQQYQRRTNIFISGIGADVSGKMIEEKVIDVLRKVDMVVTPRDIGVVHRLWVNGKKAIARFLNWKNPMTAVSSHAGLGGMDIFIEDKAKERNKPQMIKHPDELMNSHLDLDFS